MVNYEDYLANSARQEKFAVLVSARVNDIRSGTASPLSFQPDGNGNYLPVEETLMFADLIARAVCAHLDKGEEVSE